MKIYLFISILFFTFSCSKNFSKIAIQPVVPPKTAKISGNHLIYISNTKFNHNKEIKSDDGFRSIKIPIKANDERIEVVGTHVVPEFGTIAMIVLAVAIVSIIAVSAKSRLSIMPRI